MATREQGIRRTTAVTAGMVAASVAGVVAVGATAAATYEPISTPSTPADQSGAPTSPATDEELVPGPDDGGDPDAVTLGS